MANTIHVDVVSAEEAIFSGEAEFVVLPGEAGGGRCNAEQDVQGRDRARRGRAGHGDGATGGNPEASTPRIALLRGSVGQAADAALAPMGRPDPVFPVLCCIAA
jgi:hypothetical protein